MPCQHENLAHDTAAEVFGAGLVGTWGEFLDLPGLVFWFLLGLGLSLKVCGAPVIAVASATAVIWSYRSALLCSVWAVWMLFLCALESWHGGCVHSASGDWWLPGFDAPFRYHPTQPKVLFVRPKPVQATVWIPALLCLIHCLFGSPFLPTTLIQTLNTSVC